MLQLEDAVTALPGVGTAIQKRLQRLGVNCIRDLLYHFPSRYEDFSRLLPIRELKTGERVTIHGKVQLVNSRRAFRRRLNITEALISDGSGSVKAVWFNQPYLAKQLAPGTEVLLAGQLAHSKYGLQLEHPTLELAERGGIHTGRLVPIYPTVADLPQRTLRTVIARILPLAQNLADWLPKEVLRGAYLTGLAESVRQLHAPETGSALAGARRRVAFEELFLIHLASRLARLPLTQRTAAAIPFDERTKELVASLPWQLTQGQRLSAWQIIQDMGKAVPMLRLLEGDVGSGKTVVAGLACFNACLAGYQAAIMAPTEILAQQHYATLTKLFRNWPIRLGLVTRGKYSASDADEASPAVVKRRVANGDIGLTIGTHALLESSISFGRLGLIVVDEQHRFGVEQRKLLTEQSGLTPHLLSLSATPIPRSLALTIFGDLELSVLKDLPAGRRTIDTRIVPPDKRNEAYELIRREVSAGNRAFIVCPLIDESDALGVRAATEEHERLSREVFPDLKLGLLHGKLTSKDKAEALEKFRRGETPVLVCTSVIEVGVDVPEAAVMAIEGADRFGVAQLHQFRGRVGRSERQSYCLLVSDSTSPRALERLKALTKFSNGFELAEFDLSQRGPGDLLGAAQSGFFKLRFANLADAKLLNEVRRAADALLEQDQSLAHWPAVKRKLQGILAHGE